MKIIPISLFRLGSAYNYVPDVTDTGIRGNTVYEGVMPTDQAAVTEDSYSIHTEFVAEDEFSFGEIGIYDVGGRLICLESFQNEISVKLGNTYRVSVTFFDSTLVSYSASISFSELNAYTDGVISAQSKTVTPSVSQQLIQPDSGFDYLSSVTVNPIPYSEEENEAGGTTVVIGV